MEKIKPNRIGKKQICEQCGVAFITYKNCYSRIPRFCTRQCYGLSIAKMKNCFECDKQFYNYKNSMFCSMKCMGGFRKGVPLTKQHREALAEAKRGKPIPHLHNEIIRAKQSKTTKGRPQPWNWGKNHWYWKGGYSKTAQGYKMKLLKSGSKKRKMHHRFVMEEYLGRELYYKRGDSNSEVVHHINGIKTDNRIENLQVMSPSEHTKLHMQQKYA